MKKHLVNIASILFPKQLANFAYNQLANPQVLKLRENELKTLNKSEKEIFNFKSFKIQLYTWQGGGKPILLIHGWEGQAGNFSDLVSVLLAQGYTVHAFDAPSHGYSSNGKTSLFDFSNLVAILIKKFKTKLLVSHSFGGVATTYALFKNQELKIDKYVLLTTPDKFTERIDDVAQMIGINNKVKKLLLKRLEKETGNNVNVLNVSEFVKKVPVKQALIIHDKNDKVISIAQLVLLR